MNRALDDIDQAAENVRAALHEWDTPNVDDLYRLGWLLSTLPDRLRQVAERSEAAVRSTARGGRLYDDTDGDPYQRMADAAAYLDDMQEFLRLAIGSAESYHGAIGHIGMAGGDEA